MNIYLAKLTGGMPYDGMMIIAAGDFQEALKIIQYKLDEHNVENFSFETGIIKLVSVECLSMLEGSKVVYFYSGNA